MTHGNEFTCLQVFLHTLVLFAGCLLPFVFGMSSWLHRIASVAPVSVPVAHCSDALARKTFRFSLIHLSLLFAALLADHYIF